MALDKEGIALAATGLAYCVSVVRWNQCVHWERYPLRWQQSALVSRKKHSTTGHYPEYNKLSRFAFFIRRLFPDITRLIDHFTLNLRQITGELQ